MTRHLRARLDDDRGLTLVELLIVILVLGVIGAVAVSGLVQGMHTTRYSQDRGDALQATLTGVERMSREVRAADPLRTAAPDEIAVDVRRDGSLYHYQYRTVPSGGGWALEQELWRFDDPALFDDPAFVPEVGDADEASTTVLIADLAGSGPDVFEYLDAAGVPGATAEQTRRVRITIEREVDGVAEPIVVETTVKVRNA